MRIRLTSAGAERIHRYLDRREQALGLRLGVKKAGCFGCAYVVDLANAVTPEDTILVDRDVQDIVDQLHLPLLRGTEFDFAREGLDEAFVFRNPNAQSQCGCGESFGIR